MRGFGGTFSGNLKWFAGAAFIAWFATANALADGSCTGLVGNIANKLMTDGGAYEVEMTIHRSDVRLVTYSYGFVYSNASDPTWPIKGSTNQLFSDRTTGAQPFNINAADSLSLWIRTDGRLFIYYSPWGFTTSWDLTCSENVMTNVLPGMGVVTLTFRTWSPPIG